MAERLADIVTQVQNVRRTRGGRYRHAWHRRASGAEGALAARRCRGLQRGHFARHRPGSQPAAGRRPDCLPISVDAPSPPSSCFAPSRVLPELLASVCWRRRHRVPVDQATVFIVGTRGAIIAGERGIKPAWSEPMAAHADAIPSFANRLADDLYGYIADGTVAEVDLLFPAPPPVAASRSSATRCCQSISSASAARHQETSAADFACAGHLAP